MSARPHVRLAALLVLAAVIGIAAWVLTRDDLRQGVPTAEMMRRTLAQLRTAISAYHEREQRYPADLSALVSAGFLQRIPSDPVSGSRTSWRVIREKRVTADDFLPSAASDDPNDGGIVEVRSGAEGLDPSGVSWSEY